MCARLIGRLLGKAQTNDLTERALAFYAYRAAKSEHPPVPYTSREQFRCEDCGGTGVLDEFEFFTTFDEVVVPDEDGESTPPRRGRRARPFSLDSLKVSAATDALSTL